MGIFSDKNNQSSANGNEKQPPIITGEGFTYRCVENCTYQGVYYRAGETIVLTEKKEVPHFELVEGE